MASSHRPISLTDVTSKLLEKLVVMQITSLLIEKNLITSNTGFVKADQLQCVMHL